MNRWETKSLDSVVIFRGGGTPSKKNPLFWNGDIPWISPKDMKSRVIESSIDKINLNAVENSSASIIPKGSILIVVRSGILARTIPVALTARDLTVNQDIKALCPLELVDSNYLLYYLESQESKILELVTRGATVHRLQSESLKRLKVPVPSLAEQKRIVAILDEAFEGIEVAIANTEKNLTNARELFESYLNAIFTRKGKGWADKKLQEVSVKFSRGKSKHRPRGDQKLYGGKYPFIQTGDIGNSKHRITTYSQTYNELGLAQSELWPKGTVCIAIVGANIAETAILDFDACFPDSVIGIVVDETVASSDYVEYLLQFFKAELKEKGKGTARDNINLGTFSNQKFPFPNLETQKVIAHRLDELSFQTERLEEVYQRKLTALNELKQSILQKAFSGELTADVGNRVVERAGEIVAA